MSSKQVINQAYGHIPRDLPGQFAFELAPLRGMRYYFLKFLRKFTRRK